MKGQRGPCTVDTGFIKPNKVNNLVMLKVIIYPMGKFPSGEYVFFPVP